MQGPGEADANVYAYVSGQALKDDRPVGTRVGLSDGVCRSESATEPKNQSVDASSTSYGECKGGGCKSEWTPKEGEAQSSANSQQLAERDKPLEQPPLDPLDLIPGERIGRAGGRLLEEGGRYVVKRLEREAAKELIEQGEKRVAKKVGGEISKRAERALPKAAPKGKPAGTKKGVDGAPEKFGPSTVGAAQRRAASDVKFTRKMHSQSKVIARGKDINKVDKLVEKFGGNEKGLGEEEDLG